MKKEQTQQTGFTLIELLLYMAIFSILLGVMMQIFTAVLATHLNSQAASSVDQDGNFIITRLAYDLHRTSTIVSPALGSSSNTILHITGTSLDETYILTTGNLQLTNNLTSTTDQLNNVNTLVKNLTFTTIGNSAAGSKPSVQVSFTIQTRIIQTGGRQQSENFQTTIETR